MNCVFVFVFEGYLCIVFVYYLRIVFKNCIYAGTAVSRTIGRARLEQRVGHVCVCELCLYIVFVDCVYELSL